MTHIIPQPVRSLLLVDFIQAASGTFEIINADTFFSLNNRSKKAPKAEPLSKAKVVTCDF